MSCSPPGGGSVVFGPPTGMVELTPVPGIATTAMRSDAAPPLDQAIIPTWTGRHTWQSSAAGTIIPIKLFNPNVSPLGSVTFVMQLADPASTTVDVMTIYSAKSNTWADLAHTDGFLQLNVMHSGFLRDVTTYERGNVVFGLIGVQIPNAATDGFQYISTMDGAPAGVPSSYGSKVPLVYDTTNDDLYVYNGSWKKAHFA
jgi:hypothetical protein